MSTTAVKTGKVLFSVMTLVKEVGVVLSAMLNKQQSVGGGFKSIGFSLKEHVGVAIGAVIGIGVGIALCVYLGISDPNVVISFMTLGMIVIPIIIDFLIFIIPIIYQILLSIWGWFVSSFRWTWSWTEVFTSKRENV